MARALQRAVGSTCRRFVRPTSDVELSPPHRRREKHGKHRKKHGSHREFEVIFSLFSTKSNEKNGKQREKHGKQREKHGRHREKHGKHRKKHGSHREFEVIFSLFSKNQMRRMTSRAMGGRTARAGGKKPGDGWKDGTRWQAHSETPRKRRFIDYAWQSPSV